MAEITVTLPELVHAGPIMDHLRANARFESMLAQRLGAEHPAQESFLELALVYLVIADAVEAFDEARLNASQAEARDPSAGPPPEDAMKYPADQETA